MDSKGINQPKHDLTLEELAAQLDAITDLFAPFDADGILCVQDGKITTDPDEERDWTEYHIEHWHGDVWRIERSDAEETCSFVYQGRIQTATSS